ncbi:aminopeptidase P family protein [Flavobacteriaceae bacterium]|nr:aminopeptidase P family protein [Flavobacteriaceae bacterium]
MIKNIIIAVLLCQFTFAQEILSLKDRATLIEKIQKDRLDNLLPELMSKNGIDMWIIITREYNEDPIIKTLLPPTWLNARRRTILVFSFDESTKKTESVAISRYNFGKNIKSIWDKEKNPNQMLALKDYIDKVNPKKIGLNYSENFALIDGISKSDYELFYSSISNDIKQRIVSAENLGIQWIETRTKLEKEIYKDLVSITQNIINEAFSNKVIEPGKTTTDDVVWWMREKVLELKLKTWFHPTVDVQRNEQSDLYAFDGKSKYDIIQPGDLVHCDFGISYLTLNTDCQQIAYVLKSDEKEAPEFLTKALKDANKLQDILTSEFELDKTGNEILLNSLKIAKEKGLDPQIYTHPLGTFGHSAGTTIGMWDSQGGVPIKGDVLMKYNTVYAIELNNKSFIKDWNKEVRIMLEEAGLFEENGFKYINGRQEEIILINSDK